MISTCSAGGGGGGDEFKVFVGQLPFSATQADVEEHFKAAAAAGGSRTGE